MRFTLEELYDQLNRWREQLATGEWTVRDEELWTALTIMLAQPKRVHSIEIEEAP